MTARAARLALLPGQHIVVAAVAAALVLSGCGEGSGAADNQSSGTTASLDSSSASTAATVQVSDTELGSVLVDEDGMTLYLFTPDGGGSPTCEGPCADIWPALISETEPTAGDGVDGSLLGTVEGVDGSPQVTYGGHPLYRYRQDAEPGDVNGHGVNDVWFAVMPDGSAAAAQDSSPPGY